MKIHTAPDTKHAEVMKALKKIEKAVKPGEQPQWPPKVKTQYPRG